MLKQIFAAALAVGLAAPVVAEAQTKPLKKINVIMPIDRSAAFHPLLAGEALGYFAAEGLEVNLLPSSTTIPFVAFLQNRQVDLAMLDGPQTYQAINANIPITVIYEAMPTAPEGVYVSADSKYKNVAELAGTTVGLVSDRDLATLTITLELVGKKIDDVKTVVLGEAGPTLANAVKRQTVSAIAGATPDWVSLQANGIQVRDITPPEMAETPANSWVISTPRKEELRPMLEGFLRAWTKGNYAYQVDKDAVALMAKKAVPEEWENENFGRMFLDLSAALQVPKTPLYGEARPDVWKKVQAQMIKIGEISKEYDVNSFLDSSFIKAANAFDKKQVEADVKKWKAENPK